MRGRMIEDRRLGNHTEDSASYIRTAKDSNDETRAIRQTPAILTSGSKQFRLDRVEVLLGSARTMRLRGRCDSIRVGVVGCGLFATPNSLKSHKRQKELSPLVQHSCHNAKVVHAFEANTPFEKLPGTQSRTAAKSP